MKILTIKRWKPCTMNATYGMMAGESNIPFCLTLERPWRDNRRGESCIPPGEWTAKRDRYNAGGYITFEVVCPPREEIKFHIGNIDENTHGCILLGEQFEPVWRNGKNSFPGILASGHAFKEFMSKLEGEEEFKLVITEV